LAEIASSMPGFISLKGPYRNEDGEEFSIHEWQSAEQLRAWREHPEHLKVQALGREVFYEEFTIYVCDNPRTTRFKHQPKNSN
jgi:heme-degrading monooxygenase HmoA